MKLSKYLDKMRKIQNKFLEFLEDTEQVDKKFKKLKIKFEDIKIRDNKHDLRLILHLISAVSDNYVRYPNFFDKIERTLKYFKNDIKNFCSNSEIFNIFKTNKRILLFLIRKKYIIIDELFVKTILTREFTRKYYPDYFVPEIKRYVKKEWYTYELHEYAKEKLPDNYNELREKGENECLICKLIREDMIEDFIIYLNKNCISPDATIQPSIYETNSFLLEKQIQSENCISLIEYAAFFGSIQIFTFLKNQKAELTPSLWLYAIHSKNAELIHLLEELHVEHIEGNAFDEYLNESIKCHYNDIAKYFIYNYMQSEVENSKETIIKSLECYNFAFLHSGKMDKSLFCFLCYFDYYSLVKILLSKNDIDINSKIIQNHIFQ